MNHGKRFRNAKCAMGTLLFAVVGTATAQAANVVSYPGADFSTTPYTVNLQGVGSLTFSYINDGYTADAVETGGNALVNSFSFFSPVMPVPFQLGSPIGETGYDFSAFPTPVGIQYSIAEDSIGFAFTLSDGVHYGYVTTLGPKVLQYGYNDVAGASISTGAGVPEPATWAMLFIGLGLLGVATRYRINSVSGAAAQPSV